MAPRMGRWPLEMQYFIKLYKRSECLWNKNLSSYTDNEARKRAITLLNKEMKKKGYEHIDAKWRIDNLREKYEREIRKIEASKRSGGTVHKPTFRWFEPLDAFLRPFFTNRGHNANTVIYRNTDESVAGSIAENSNSTQVVESGDAEDKEPKLPAPKKMKTKDNSDDLTVNKSPEMPPASLTSYDLFRQNVAVHLKNLPKQQALSMHSKLQAILAEELFNCHVETSSESHRNPW